MLIRYKTNLPSGQPLLLSLVHREDAVILYLAARRMQKTESGLIILMIIRNNKVHLVKLSQHHGFRLQRK